MAAAELRFLLDHAPGLLCALDGRLCCRIINERGARWFGVDAAAAEGKPLGELVGASNWADLRPAIETAIEDGECFELEVACADQERRRVRVTVASTASEPADLVLTMEDLHERVALERLLVANAEQLDRSNAAFKAIIEQSPDGIFVHRGGRVVYVNPARVR